MQLEIVYCLPDEQVVVSLDVDKTCSVTKAIELSGLLEQFSLGDIQDIKLGIYGKKIDLDSKLNEFDRIEIYRDLLLSPTEARRLSAKTKVLE